MQAATSEHKLAHLREIIAGYESALVTFSGGVDSTFLLKVAGDVLGERCHALTCVSVTMASSESLDARLLGDELGFGPRHHVVDSNELEQPGFAGNPVQRCALCKTELMEIASPLAQRLELSTVLLGTNVDDLGDFRPGISAAAKLGARAPMVDAGLTKAEIRDLSRSMGLRTWNKPQLACLSSRFPYGTEITPARLRRVDAFEDGLRDLGFMQVRVRYHDTIARIEVEEQHLATVSDHAKDIVALGKSLGFTYVTMDLAGFRTGSLNEELVTLRKGSKK